LEALEVKGNNNNNKRYFLVYLQYLTLNALKILPEHFFSSSPCRSHKTSEYLLFGLNFKKPWLQLVCGWVVLFGIWSVWTPLNYASQEERLENLII